MMEDGKKNILLKTKRNSSLLHLGIRIKIHTPWKRVFPLTPTRLHVVIQTPCLVTELNSIIFDTLLRVGMLASCTGAQNNGGQRTCRILFRVSYMPAAIFFLWTSLSCLGIWVGKDLSAPESIIGSCPSLLVFFRVKTGVFSSPVV